MNIESSPVPASDGMEKMLATFASAHPEFKDMTAAEIAQAAELIEAQDAVSDEETFRKASRPVETYAPPEMFPFSALMIR